MRALPQDRRVKAVAILRWIEQRLENMTSDEFSRGADRDIRDEITAYLTNAE